MLITFAVIFLAFYIILIRIFRVGWKSVDDFKTKKKPADFSFCPVSVVVCCRNEKDNLPYLILALKKQTYQNFELILVNDHSEDSTANIMKQALAGFSDAMYIEATKEGKKQALGEGIERAKGELIIVTDADCEPVPAWIETILLFQQEFPSHLIIGPVKLAPCNTFFSRLQAFEFTTLTASGAGMAGSHMPIMCNAANLAFTKEAWIKSKGELKPEEPSGDDIFLLQSIKKRGGIIRYLRSKKAFVNTKPAENLSAFFRQRRRWAGKSSAYTDWQLIATACIVFGVCLMELLLLIFSFFNTLYLYILILLFVVKFLFDVRFLHDVSDFFSLKSVFFYALCLSLVYPFYIVFTAVSALLFKPKRWK